MIEIKLPWPDSNLNPNKVVHFRKKAKIKKAQKEEANKIASIISPVFEGFIELDITFCPPTKHRRDLDNLLNSMKSALDGISEAWNIDDRNFRPIKINFGEIKKGGEVLIKFKEID